MSCIIDIGNFRKAMGKIFKLMVTNPKNPKMLKVEEI